KQHLAGSLIRFLEVLGFSRSPEVMSRDISVVNPPVPRGPVGLGLLEVVPHLRIHPVTAFVIRHLVHRQRLFFDVTDDQVLDRFATAPHAVTLTRLLRVSDLHDLVTLANQIVDLVPLTTVSQSVTRLKPNLARLTIVPTDGERLRASGRQAVDHPALEER